MKPICTRIFPCHYGWVIIATGALATVTVFFAAGQGTGDREEPVTMQRLNEYPSLPAVANPFSSLHSGANYLLFNITLSSTPEHIQGFHGHQQTP